MGRQGEGCGVNWHMEYGKWRERASGGVKWKVAESISC